MLSAYERIEILSPATSRTKHIDDLAALPLHSAEVKGARDVCVAAHRALLLAERTQDQAATSLEQAIRNKPNGEPLAQPETTRVSRDIQAADTALSAARAQFAPCEAQVQSLSLRYARRAGG